MSRRILFSSILLLSSAVFAQKVPLREVARQSAEPAALNQRQPDPEEGLIQLDVTVTDASGKPVAGLDRSDFTLLDNDKPAKILTFHASDLALQKPDAPTELILVLDQLNLNPRDAAEAEKLLDEFLRQDGGHLALPTSIYRLSSNLLSTTAQPSTDGNALADALAKKKGMNAPTQPSTDAKAQANEMAKRNGMRAIPWNFSYLSPEDQGHHVLLSQSALGSIALEAMKKPGRKLVVWIGYGWPAPLSSQTHNFDEITEFSTRLREAHITLYRVNAWDDPKINNNNHPYDYRNYLEGVQAEKDAAPAKASLEVLATQSGGAVYGITKLNPADYVNGHPSADQMAHIVLDSLGRIVAENSASYSLSIDPPHIETFDDNNHGPMKYVDHYHELRVEIHKPGLVTHTRAGYYDEPVYYDQPRSIPAQHLSVAQLEQMLEQDRREPDWQLVLELSNLELTERMSSAKLNTWKNRLPGKKAWQALVAVADASIFLAPPAAEIPALPEPTLAEQREQLMRIVRYLGEMAPKLPNLMAMRTTDRYEEPKLAESETWKTARADRSLHLEASSTVTIRNQNGGDFIESASGKEKKAKKGARSLETNGTFGAILGTVVSDAIHGKVTWGGWETGDSGQLEVFRYSVPENQSHFNVSECCYPDYLGGGVFQRMPAYHGDIAFDPASGAILRLTVQTDLSEKMPLMRSDIAVEYGKVETGGRSYFCPMRSVSISRGRTLRMIPAWGEYLQIFGPFETLLIDVSFRDYHRFGSTSRILPASQEAP
jgi:VWFA-related protein